MARQMRSSRILDKAQRRLSSIQSIDEKLDLGSGLTAQSYVKTIDGLRKKIDAYNKALSNVDALQNQVNEAERMLADQSEQMLMGVAVKFGKNSSEYEMAGGVKKSERKKPARRLAAAAN